MEESPSRRTSGAYSRGGSRNASKGPSCAGDGDDVSSIGSAPQTPGSSDSSVASGGRGRAFFEAAPGPLGFGGLGGLGGLGGGFGSSQFIESTDNTKNPAGLVPGENGGWAPVGQGEGDQPTTLVASGSVIVDLSESMVTELNNVYSFVHHLVARERSRHASSVSLMMRKVDKDLKATFKSVQDIFSTLSEQLILLLKEVESSRGQLKTITDKYRQVRENADAQAVYVLELEAVLNGQGNAANDTLRALEERNQSAKEADKAGDSAKRRVEILQGENRELKAQMVRLQRAAKEAQTGASTPMLPEMAASWTRRGSNTQANGFGEHDPATPSSPSGGGRQDIVGTVMDHCDRGRQVSRSKWSKTICLPAATPRRAQMIREEEETLASLRRRAEKAEANLASVQKLQSFSATSLLLLRDVFTELRRSGCIVPGTPASQVELEPRDAVRIVDHIVQLFQKAIPKLGSLPDVLKALNEEAVRSAQRRKSPRTVASDGSMSSRRRNLRNGASTNSTDSATAEDWSVELPASPRRLVSVPAGRRR